jgi:pimeloyl-ACP methyl ester carboxylesterase
MIIPGFMGDDLGNGPLIRFLRSRGYAVAGWGQGRNLGVNTFDEDKLREDLKSLVDAGDGKVSLVGHSLGGIYAREIARADPQYIRQVITLGSPFGQGGKNASHANTLYQHLNPAPDARDVEEQLAVAPPVPTAAIYTRGDGIVNWRSSVQHSAGEHIHNIEVLGSHIGLNLNAAVWYWITRKLAEY